MIEQIKAKKHPFIMCNFAPPDMVGHTGVYEAAIKACEATGTSLFPMNCLAIVLLQKNDEGIEHPVAFFSKTLRDVELRYDHIKK